MCYNTVALEYRTLISNAYLECAMCPKERWKQNRMAGKWSTNAAALAARNRKRAEDVQRGLAEAARAQAKAMKADAVRLSSGTSTPGARTSKAKGGRLLSALGLPIGIGLALDAQREAKINVITGVFRASWTAGVQPQSRSEGGQWLITLANTSPEGRFLLGGTRFMAARPLLSSVQKDTAGQLRARAGRVIKKAVG